MLCYKNSMRRFCVLLLLPAALLAGPFDAIRKSIRRQLTESAAPSISKPFTATALMTMVQSGKIELDRSVGSQTP
jgi:CubicO group peptidase (beta-lactamase class C family)